MSFPSHLSPPRLCHLKKWTTFAGYGFNLHAEKGKAGQYIGKVDPDSPAEHGGLKTKDYLVEVNSVNVEDLSHQKVVEIVKEMPDSVNMLVVDFEAYKYCKEKEIHISSTMPEVILYTTPDTQPSAVGVIEEHQEIRHETVASKQHPEAESAPAVATNEDVIFTEEHEVAAVTEPEQQQQRQPSPTNQRDPAVSSTNGASAPANKDPVGNISLDEMRAKIGNNRRTQVKMNPSSFSEKHSMFQAL